MQAEFNAQIARVENEFVSVRVLSTWTNINHDKFIEMSTGGFEIPRNSVAPQLFFLPKRFSTHFSNFLSNEILWLVVAGCINLSFTFLTNSLRSWPVRNDDKMKNTNPKIAERIF